MKSLLGYVMRQNVAAHYKAVLKSQSMSHRVVNGVGMVFNRL